MKRAASFLLIPMMIFSLAACAEGGPGLGPKDDPGVRYGGIGDTLSTEWFDFVVNEAHSCSEYHGYIPAAGCKLVVVAMSLRNNCGRPVDIWGEDFAIFWGNGGGASDMDIPLPAGISGDQFPDTYALDANASKSGVMVFEVPEEFRELSVGFMEILDDGGEGSTYFVDFTAEDR